MPFHAAQALILALVFGLPTVSAGALVVLASEPWLRLLGVALALPIWMVLYPIACGVASLPYRSAIVKGVLPRDLRDPRYRRRRLYGLCWTSLYYAPLAYHFVLAWPLLKRIVFRLFGYGGTMNFTVYPDTWIRDLPLLDFGEGAYLANKATIGTNMPLMDGGILVDKVTVGNNAFVGHQAMMAAGSSLGDGSETGAGSCIAVRTHVGKNVTTATGPVVLDHYARIGDGATLGTCTYVGKRARVGPGVSVPERFLVPGAAHVRTDDDVQRLASR